jgi:TonB family protein
MAALLLTLGETPGATAASSHNVGKELKDRYRGQTLILRHFYSGAKLTYSSDGALIEGGPAGSWTLDAGVHVKQVKLGESVVEFQGYRLCQRYNPNAKQFKAGRSYKVTIGIELSAPARSFEELQPLLTKVFLSPTEKLTDFVPDYWQHFLSGSSEWTTPSGPSSGPAIHDEKDASVTPPHPVHRPEPPFTEEARKMKYQGTVVLGIIVNAEGKTEGFRIIQPLGCGLDEQAIDTVRKWRFKPGTRNGVPVSVHVIVAVTFRLF